MSTHLTSRILIYSFHYMIAEAVFSYNPSMVFPLNTFYSDSPPLQNRRRRPYFRI